MSSATIVRALKKQAKEATYTWKPGSRIPVDATTAMREFGAIYQTYGGITPDMVVERASTEDSPLHPAFTWDDSEAARQYRETEARLIMRSLVVVVRREDGTPTAPVRAIVKLTPDADDPLPDNADDTMYLPRTYVPIMSVMNDADQRQRHVRKAFRDLLTWRQNYRELVEFVDIFERIDAMRETVAS